MTISAATAFLESAYSTLNKDFFENKLPKVQITIQTSPKAYGHFTCSEVWKGGKKESYHEINIGAETLNRPVSSTIGTLLHEMVHCYCAVNGIQDTSRNHTYHNKRFRDEAIKRGLLISYDEKIGWSITEPSKDLKSYCAKHHWNGKLTIARQGDFGSGGEPKPKKPSSTRKYICPCCGASCRATRDLQILCIPCDCVMEIA